MKFRFKTAIGIFALLAVAAAVVMAGGHLWAVYRQLKAVFPEHAAVVPEFRAELGSEVEVSFDAEIPVNLTIAKAEFFPGSGCVAVGSVGFDSIKPGWAKKWWRFRSVMRPVRRGMSGKGYFEIELVSQNKDGESQKFRVKVPEIEAVITRNSASQELLLAPPLVVSDNSASLSRSRILWLSGGIAAAALIALAFWMRAVICRRRKCALWLQAENAVFRAIEDFNNGTISGEEAYVLFSEIIRSYLAERYGVGVLPCTTAEFLKLCRDEEILPDEQRQKLDSFLNSADMVKFACSRAEDTAVERAADRAVDLIRATIPPEKGGR